ncbi:hypothetical protein [uncultured Desulfovibrio sp.]|uniref:hypothetical protein n=1 Tax=uncultured Desulfovibrio sp. TaxID=167968 RepID=UPI00260A8175|nr:hypothetical protein [uncultured Desulfovibrio sp.]
MTKEPFVQGKPVEGVVLAEGGQARVDLADGLAVGSVTYSIAVLRQLNAGAVLAAAEASERLVSTAQGMELVSSPARMGAELLRRQIARMEDGSGNKLDGPLDMESLGRLSARDMDTLNFAARMLDAAAEKSMEGLAGRGRHAAGSGQSGEAAGQTDQPGHADV